MNEARTIEGRWWIFGRSRAPHYGILEYRPEEGLSLTVKIPKSRTLEQILKGAAHGRRSVAKAIQGQDEHDRPVTLFGCAFPSELLAGGLAVYQVSPIYALLGGHYDSWDTTMFRRVVARYSLLNEWLGRTGIRHLPLSDGRPAVTFSAPPDIVIQLGQGETARITTQFATGTSRSEYRIGQTHAVDFKFPGEMPARQIFADYILVFNRVLTLFAGARVFIESLQFVIEEAGRDSTLEFLTRNRGISKERLEQSADQSQVRYSEIQNKFPRVVQNWFSYHGRLDSVLNLYFSTVFNRELYINHRFLFLAQALDVYHGSNPAFSSAVEPRKEFRERVRKLLPAIPVGERSWLKDKLQHANQKTLAQRLKEILAANRSEARKLIRKQRKFADRVRHTRNYYTKRAECSVSGKRIKSCS